MPETQLELVAAHRPLLEKFGSAFFKDIPSVPGVYIMTGRDERVLYVGQSSNLHNRLGTYKNARTGKTSRKTLRLVHSVESITWETCASARAAILRENALLRLHRPRFNRMNTYPAAYSFISLKFGNCEIELARTTDAAAPGELYGAFKAHVIAGYASLLRLTWAALNGPEGIHAFPRPLLASRPPASWLLRCQSGVDCQQLPTLLRTFLEGSSDAPLLCWVNERLPQPGTLHPFHRAFQQADLESLRAFFIVGPKRNRALVERQGLVARVIGQEELDDLLAGSTVRGLAEAGSTAAAQP